MSLTTILRHLLLLIHLSIISFSSGSIEKEQSFENQMDVTSPITTVPTITPGDSNSITPPKTTNPTPSSSTARRWCVASQFASPTALQVALDFACGYGHVDCSLIQPGAACYNPDTLRHHASFAFNDYYRKNPIPTSCSFGGTALTTTTDPSSGTCQYPATSTTSSILNTTNSNGATIFGSGPSIPSSKAPSPFSHTTSCIMLNIIMLLTTNYP